VKEVNMQVDNHLTIIAIAVAEPGKEALLREAQARLVESTIKESGCIRYELHQSIEDGSVLIFVETWENDAAWRAHMQGDAIRRFQAGGAGRFIQDFTLHRMALVADGKSRKNTG
jgi:quinol monooxygenase YgiN